MDPLSVIASTMTIAAPIAVGLQTIRENRHAKPELLLLSNEVADIVLLLQELDQVLQNPKQSIESRPSRRLLQALDATRAKFQELSKQVLEWQKSSTTHPLRWIVIGSKVRALKEELQRIRSELMTVLSTMNL